MAHYKIDSQDVLFNKDEDGREYITLIYRAEEDTRECETEVSFYVDNLAMPREEPMAIWSNCKIAIPAKPKNIVFELKYNEHGSCIKTTITEKTKKMTKDEIEKELGYKIDIVG